MKGKRIMRFVGNHPEPEPELLPDGILWPSGHAWLATCFSHSGMYGNCECGKADYVTYSQHQKHLAEVARSAAE